MAWLRASYMVATSSCPVAMPEARMDVVVPADGSIDVDIALLDSADAITESGTGVYLSARVFSFFFVKRRASGRFSHSSAVTERKAIFSAS